MVLGSGSMYFEESKVERIKEQFSLAEEKK